MPPRTDRTAALAASTPLVLLALLLPVAAMAQSILALSPDVTVALGAAGVITTDGDVAVDNRLGIVALESLGPIPESADLIGYGELAGGTKLMAFDTTLSFPGGVVARPGDVVAWNGVSHSLYFDARSAGIPSGVQTDALSLSANGLLLSFDTDVSLPGSLVVADEDLVRWNGTSFALAFDGSAAGLDRALDIDAVEDLGGGQLLISFDTAGFAGGVEFRDEDLIRHAAGVFTLEFDGSAEDADWGAADLDAIQVPEAGADSTRMAGLLALVALARLHPRRRTLRTARS